MIIKIFNIYSSNKYAQININHYLLCEYYKIIYIIINKKRIQFFIG